MIENIILWHHDVFARSFMIGVSNAAHSESSDVSDCHNWRLSDDEIGLAQMVAQGWLLRVTSVVKGVVWIVTFFILVRKDEFDFDLMWALYLVFALTRRRVVADEWLRM